MPSQPKTLSFGERLKQVRGLLDWSQRDLARELGVDGSTVALWENDRRKVPGPVRKLLALYEIELGLAPPAHSPAPIIARAIDRGQKLSGAAASAGALIAASAFDTLLRRDVLEGRAHAIALEIEAAAATALAKRLGALKGLGAKLGQMIGHLGVAMPERVRAPFAALQTTAPAMPGAAVAEIMVEDFGRTPRQIFSQWCSRPVAVGSIGQVHRASLPDSREVAVKVQNPEGARALAADLEHLGGLARLYTLFFRGKDAHVIAGELGDAFAGECDYRREAENVAEFHRLFAHRADVLVPRPHPALCSARVLTCEWVAGQSFAEFTRSASFAARSRAGEIIFDVVFTAIFAHRLFNADPHPDNYLFKDDGVVFLDFGCVKRLSPEFVALLKSFMLAHFRGDRRGAAELAIAAGFVADRDRFDFDAHFDMVQALYRPWLTRGKFRFDRAFVRDAWRRLVRLGPNRRYLRLPPDRVLLMRVEWGLFAVLAELEAEADWGEIMRGMLEA